MLSFALERRNDSTAGSVHLSRNSTRRPRSSLRSDSPENATSREQTAGMALGRILGGRALRTSHTAFKKSGTFLPRRVFRQDEEMIDQRLLRGRVNACERCFRVGKASSPLGNIRSINRYRELRAMPPIKKITIERLISCHFITFATNSSGAGLPCASA
jgi:hypothetical protein